MCLRANPLACGATWIITTRSVFERLDGGIGVERTGRRLEPAPSHE